MDPGHAEGPACKMADEHAGRRDVTPSEMAGTDAEIVFLAVAVGEQVLAQRAHLIQAVTPDIHTETDRGRNIDDRPAIGRAGKTIEMVGLGLRGYFVAS